MGLFLKYLRQHCGTVLFFAGTVLIFAFVFSLYNLETEAVWYAAGLCLFFGAVVTGVRFVLFRGQYQERERLLQNITVLSEPLPEPKTSEQAQWIAMIEELRAYCRDHDTVSEQERTEMLDYFTVWVHQIKIPISVMHMTLAESDTDESRALTDELFRIEQYAEMVLCYFRLDTAAADLVSERVQLDEVIRAGVRKYAPLFIRKRIRIDYAGTDSTAVTDSKWLQFIIEQLLSNAVKYTAAGSVKITVSERTVTVSDTGIGIAAEDIPRIFERGYTGCNGRNTEKSTGLGLYLVKKACSRLGITIRVESTIGKGTAVSLLLPEDTRKE